MKFIGPLLHGRATRLDLDFSQADDRAQGLSKAMSMTGWRLGGCAVRKQLSQRADTSWLCDDLCFDGFTKAALAAWTPEGENARAIFARRF